MAIIRQTLMDTVVTKLQAITYANSYSREVGTRRVYSASKLPQQIPTPCVIVLQGPERVDNRIGDRYECSLALSVAFVESYGGPEPDDEANKFLADIQKAVNGADFSFTTTNYSSGASVTTFATLLEVSNSINAGEPVEGKVYGEVQYELGYVRSIFDPEKQ
jgi:hypothetical protein